MGNIVKFPELPTDFDPLFKVEVAVGGQIYVTCETLDFPEPLMWALSDLCQRMIDFGIPKKNR